MDKKCALLLMLLFLLPTSCGDNSVQTGEQSPPVDHDRESIAQRLKQEPKKLVDHQARTDRYARRIVRRIETIHGQRARNGSTD